MFNLKVWNMLFAIICTLLVRDVLSTEKEAVVLRASRGVTARLPCGDSQIFLDGPKAYVLWLKDDHEFLYRFPNDDTDDRFSYRKPLYDFPCDNAPCFDDTWLVLEEVAEKDEGRYRCKINYQASASVDFVYELKMVDSPGTPKLYDGEGNAISTTYLGPFTLGSEYTLVCEVEKPHVDTIAYWHRNGVMIKQAQMNSLGLIRLDVHFFNLTRNELGARYECLARNSDVSDNMATSVIVRMYLPPMSTEIRLNNNHNFEAGVARVVDCVVIGCIPPPVVTWHLGSTMLRSNVHKELHDGNYTVSSLTLTPTLLDDNRSLICKAHNSHLPTEKLTDKVTVHVGYRPVCQTSREENVGVVANEFESLICVVDASPQPLQFSWTFADSTTYYTSLNQEVSGQHNYYSSTLAWPAREEDIGVLFCRATNIYGQQKFPCAFIISKGGPPAMPQCELLRAYPRALRVQCKTGWDGGRPQNVHLEVINEDGSVVANVTDRSGQFFLPHIMDERNLTAILYASNSRGRSIVQRKILQSLTGVITSTIEEYHHPWLPYLEAFAGAVVLTIVVVSITLGSKFVIARRERGDLSPDIVPQDDGTFHREPDFFRDDRIHTTSITVTQLPPYQRYPSFSVSPRSVARGHRNMPNPPPSPPPYYFV